jgi:hypothetical protein
MLLLAVCLLAAPVDAEPEPEPAPDVAEPEPESESEPEPEPEPESEPESEPAAEAEPPTESFPETAPTKTAEPVVEAETEKKLGSNVEVTGEPGKGLTVKVGDAFSLNIKSRMQIRYQLDIPNGPQDNMLQTVNIGTARIWLSGNILSPKFLYMIQLAVAGRDYRDGATSPIFDAFVDWKVHRDFSLKAGQYFVPFDRLRTVREFALQMADRPRPVAELTLDRDVGVTMYSDTFLHDKSPVAYRIGAFGGGGTNLTTGKFPGGLFVGRLELRPLGPIDDDSEGDLERRKKPALALGGAFAANLNTNRLRSTTGATFTGGRTHYFHGAADLVFKWWGFALQGEYLRKVASVNDIFSTDEEGMPVTEWTRTAEGWVAQASYVFDPPIEIVGRMSGLYALGRTDPALIAELEQRGQEVGAGLNYYFNGHRMKLQTDWIALMPYNFDFGEAAHVVHLQLDVTF